MEDFVSTEFTHKGWNVAVQYSSYSDMMEIIITDDEMKEVGYADGASVDEIVESIDDVVESMENGYYNKEDHESKLLNELTDLDDDELEELEEHIIESVQEYEEANKGYQEYLGYKMYFTYNPEKQILVSDIKGVGIVERKSLQSLCHHSVLKIQEYLDSSIKNLKI